MRITRPVSWAELVVSFCLCLVIPFLVVLKAPGYQPLSFVELSISVLLLLMLAIGIFFSRVRRLPALFLLLVFALFFYHVAIATASDSIPAAFASIMLHDRFIIISLIVILFLSHKGEDFAVKLFICVALFTTYVTIVKIFRDPSSMLSLYGESGFYKESSVFPNPNMYGVYISSVVILCLPRLSELFFRTGKYNYIFVLSPLLVVTILTFSRRSWLALLMGVCLFFLFKRGRSHIVAIALFAVVAAFIWLTDSATIADRFLLIFDSGYASNAERLEATSSQLQVVSGSISTLFGGAGVGMFGPASMYSNDGQWGQIDGYYTQVLLEFGLLGLALYFSILIYVAVITIGYLRAGNVSDNVYNKVLSYLITLTMLYFVATVGSTPITFPLNLLQWLLIGVLVKHIKWNRNDAAL